MKLKVLTSDPVVEDKSKPADIITGPKRAKRVLFFWPSTSNRGRISMSMPILCGIAKTLGWETRYFDTSFYHKSDDAVLEKEKTGGFKAIENAELPEGMQLDSQALPDLQKILDDFKPSVIAITGMTNCFEYMMTFFDDLKIPKETVVAFGGTHSLHRSEEILNTGKIHISCFGQGEKILPEILRRAEHGIDLQGIAGTSAVDSNGKITRYSVDAPLSADELWAPELDYTPYDARYYEYPFDGKMVNMFLLEVGRGCPYNCTYCEAPQLRNMYAGKGKYVLSRPMDNIFYTIKKLQEKFDIDVFNITHECFLSQPRDWIKEFCSRWGREVKKSFLIQTRLETVDEHKIALLKLSNAPIIQIGQGIESGSDRVLHDICNRNMDRGAIIESYKILNDHGFRTNAYYMMGFPTETREDIFETIELCRQVNSDIDSVAIFQPFPELPLTRMCLENGWITGEEIIPTYTERSIIKQPSISIDEVSNLRRVFLLYAKLPKKYWPEIEKCEQDYENNKDLFDHLIDVRWELQNTSTAVQGQPLSSC